jgi:prepilin-type N-terminal cleavage/methylation domain-containing protein
MYSKKSDAHRARKGFTIVELLVVIVVIGILAAVTIVAFNGVQQKAAAVVLKSDLKNAFTQLEIAEKNTGTYLATTASLQKSEGTNFEYTLSGEGYCLSASSAQAGTSAFHIDSTTGTIQEGVCVGHTAPGGVSGSSPSDFTIVASPVHSCVLAIGQAYCWGAGGNGTLGNGGTADSNVPLAVSTTGVLIGKTVTAIATGTFHSCALADGQAYCWGSGSYGRLGDGTTTTSNIPVAVSTTGVLSGKTVTAIATGTFHSCALADGQAYCWGRSNYGQLGDGTTTTQSDVPVAVSTAGVLSGKTVTAITAGDTHSCALADDQAYCWGRSSYGQLGAGSTATSTIPVAVSTAGVLGGKIVTAVTAGTTHSCALADGQAYCWGRGDNGRLGTGSTALSSTPVAVSTAGVLSGKTVTAITAGNTNSCAVADGQAYCWGRGDYGQLGDGNTVQADIPVAVSTAGVLGGKTVTAIATGNGHGCAVADGQAYCWGRGDNGQLGAGSTTYSSVPVIVSPLP